MSTELTPLAPESPPAPLTHGCFLVVSLGLRVLRDVPAARCPDAADAGEILEEVPVNEEERLVFAKCLFCARP